MFGQLCETKRLRFLDDDAQYPVTGWQGADQRPCLVVDAAVDELAEHSVLVQYPKCPVTGPDQLGSGVHDLPQRGVQFQTG